MKPCWRKAQPKDPQVGPKLIVLRFRNDSTDLDLPFEGLDHARKKQ